MTDDLRLDDVQEILRIFNESDLEELRIELGSTRLYLSKRSAGAQPGGWESDRGDPADVADAPAGIGEGPAVTPSELPPGPGSVTTDGGNYHELRSPLLGIFHRRPSPEKPPFVEVGTVVGADDPVCIVDVMKVFTRVPSGVAGRVVEICAEDGQLVEHGQVLMRIDATG